MTFTAEGDYPGDHYSERSCQTEKMHSQLIQKSVLVEDVQIHCLSVLASQKDEYFLKKILKS
jgi:hypothetical protein